MICSSVENYNERPVFMINGSPADPCAYITYVPAKAAYDDFAAAGFRLYSVPVFFADRTINEIGRTPSLSAGIFDREEPDLSIADGLFEQILAACPEAYIFPRVNLSLPLRWERAHPDELCDSGFSPDRRPCFSSDRWAEATKEFLGQFIDHIENAPYRDRICGYQLSGGNTEEWIPFDQKGSIGKRSREKFDAYCAANGLEKCDEEYYGFLSRMVAERICEFAAFTKEKTGRRLAVGAFYGYTFDLPDRKMCHHALGRVLEDPNVDFLCSPVSYMENRFPAIAPPYMVPLESLKLHGKLYFSENDTRTHLTCPPFPQPHYNTPVWQPQEKWVSLATLKTHFARALVNAHALWWFDMWGGWFRDPLYMQMLGNFRRIALDSLEKDGSSVAEVAVLVDETAFRYVEKDTGKKACYWPRKQLGRMGTPFDSYLASDYERIKGRYKALIVMAPYRTSLIERIIAENPECLVIGSDTEATTEQLRQFCRDRGVHLYSEKDAVIYANKSYLFLHTVEAGTAELRLPAGKRLRQIDGEPIDPETTPLTPYEGYLFEFE